MSIVVLPCRRDGATRLPSLRSLKCTLYAPGDETREPAAGRGAQSLLQTTTARQTKADARRLRQSTVYRVRDGAARGWTWSV